MCDLEWLRFPRSGLTELVNLSQIFYLGSRSGSILSIVPRGAPDVSMRRICVCDCLYSLSSLSLPTPSGLRAAGRCRACVDDHAHVHGVSFHFRAESVRLCVFFLV